ncbi:MAG: histidinol-phosphate transaminase [Armatimonadota bacterium]
MPRTWDLIRDTIKRITPYSPGKSSKEVMEELGLDEVTKLASNENPLGPSPKAIEAMHSAAENVHSYPDIAWRELAGALGEHLQVRPECIIVGRGSDEIIFMLCTTFINEGDEVIFSEHPFAAYPLAVFQSGAVPVTVPRRDDFRHDLDAMARAITDRTKIIYIPNPCNPTGTIITADEMDAFMRRVPDHVIVAFDEAYYEYVGDPDFPDCLQYARQGRKVVVLRTFSKAYGLAGLRVGYGACAKSVADVLKLVVEPFNVSLVSQEAAIAALQDQQHVEKSHEMVAEGREYLYGEFDRMGLQYVPSEANFVLVDTGVHSREVFDGLMQQGVTIRTGDIWGLHTWIRVTVGTPEHNKKFIGALEGILDG